MRNLIWCALGVLAVPLATAAGDVGADNVPLAEAIEPAAVDVFTFPAVGDERFTLLGDNFWNEGDYVEGSRALTSAANTIDMSLSIDNNVLSCDTQDHVVMIDGESVGSFSVSAGDVVVNAMFQFDELDAGDRTIRIETVRTVDPGCGSAGFPNDVSTMTFSDGGCAMHLEARGVRGAIAARIDFRAALHHSGVRTVSEKVRVEVLDVFDRVIAADGFGPFEFVPGETVTLAETVTLPADTQSGEYRLVVSIAQMSRWDGESVAVVLGDS